MIQLTDTTFDRCEVHTYDIKKHSNKKVPKNYDFLYDGRYMTKKQSRKKFFFFFICKTSNRFHDDICDMFYSQGNLFICHLFSGKSYLH